MKMKTQVDPTNYQIGVIMARFQGSKIHAGQAQLINDVLAIHSKIIIVLGITNSEADNSNPMDYATRELMVKAQFPTAVVLPLKDINDDHIWSARLDALISIPYGELSAVLYGSRDSFLPHYKGKHATIEFIPELPDNNTEHRKKVAGQVRASEDFRAGIIYSVYSRRPVTYPTVDVVAYNDNKEILLAKKPNEKLYRFIGGFVDPSDESYEIAAKREFGEETSNSSIDGLEYIASTRVKDWRYAKSKNGIMTTLFAGKYIFGKAKASDDIESLTWLDPFKLNVDTDIMPEHRDLFKALITRLPNIFDRMDEE